jgi:hypothetical protein
VRLTRFEDVASALPGVGAESLVNRLDRDDDADDFLVCLANRIDGATVVIGSYLNRFSTESAVRIADYSGRTIGEQEDLSGAHPLP